MKSSLRSGTLLVDVALHARWVKTKFAVILRRAVCSFGRTLCVKIKKSAVFAVTSQAFRAPLLPRCGEGRLERPQQHAVRQTRLLEASFRAVFGRSELPPLVLWSANESPGTLSCGFLG